MHVVVTGSSGLVGSALVEALRGRGDRVTRLVRREPSGPDEARWSPGEAEIDASALRGADAVVHLAGAGIGDRRWNEEHKRAVLSSRVEGTRLVSETLASLGDGPRILLSGSAIGWYGDTGDREVDETAPAGEGFLAEVCVAWEAATAAAEGAGLRVCHLRTGLVQSGRGGLLKRVLPLFRLGVGGRLGSGQQYMSWIALQDEVGAIVHLLDADVSGPVNLTAPRPVTNATWTDTVGTVVGRPTVIPVPAAALRVVLGREMAEETALISQRVVPAVLAGSGYSFAHPELEPALRAELG